MSGKFPRAWPVAMRRWLLGGAMLSLAAALGAVMVPGQPAVAARGTVVQAMPADGPSGQISSAVFTHKCLQPGTENDSPVVLWDCNGSTGQTFTIESDGSIQINGLCLDASHRSGLNKTPVVAFTCDGATNQQWAYTSANQELVVMNSGKCLDIPRSNTANGTQLIVYTCNAGRNQRWTVPVG